MDEWGQKSDYNGLLNEWRCKNEGGYQRQNKQKYLKLLKLKEGKLRELVIDGPDLPRNALNVKEKYCVWSQHSPSKCDFFSKRNAIVQDASYEY